MGHMSGRSSSIRVLRARTTLYTIPSTALEMPHDWPDSPPHLCRYRFAPPDVSATLILGSLVAYHSVVCDGMRLVASGGREAHRDPVVHAGSIPQLLLPPV